jgi:hypothetical protein
MYNLMRKTLFLIFIVLSILGNTSIAQEAFNKKSIIFTGGIGSGIGFSFNNNTPLQNYSNSSTYGYGTIINYNFPFTAEYAIHNKWSLGLSLTHNKYLKYPIKAKGNDWGVFGSLHFLRKEHIEMYVRMGLGLSTMNIVEETGYYHYYEQIKLLYRMTGLFVKPSWGFRYFFNNHIGFFVDGGFKLFSLTTDKYETSDGETYSLNPKARMTNINLEVTTGLAVKF